MNKYLLLYALGTTALLAAGLHSHRAEARRWERNCASLEQSVEHYRTRSGKEAASVEALRLRCKEFEALRSADAARIRALGIKLRRLEAAAQQVTRTVVEVRTPVRDTVVMRDTVRLFCWRDPWVRVEGAVGADTVSCRVESVDTLRQIVHRVPRRFLFIRWGTKAVRQEIVSTNPHTRIICSEYVRFER